MSRPNSLIKILELFPFSWKTHPLRNLYIYIYTSKDTRASHGALLRTRVPKSVGTFPVS